MKRIKTIYESIFGSVAKIRILKFLSRFINKEKKFTITEISEITKIPRPTTYRTLKDLVKKGLISEEYVGKTGQYKLMDSWLVRELVMKPFKTESSVFTIEANRIANEMKKIKGVNSVILFGSVARKEENLKSDIDLLLLSRSGYDESGIKKKAIKIISESTMPFSLIVLTEEEFKKRYKKDVEFEKNIMREGKILFGKKPSVD